MFKKIVRIALFCIILPLFSVESGQMQQKEVNVSNQNIQDVQSTGIETDDLFDTGYKIAPMEKVQLKSLSREEKLIWAIRMSDRYTFL